MQRQQSHFGPGPMTTGGYPPTQAHLLYPTPSAAQSTSTVETKVAEDPRQVSRTPSPTPSEQKELSSGAIDWKTISKPKFWFRREWLWFYVIFFVILVLTALITIYHTQIVHWLQPFTNWVHGLKFGWLVPIAILFVISFPPLFGHEIVAVLCGLVWGLWIGFGIVAAGTFLGELGNFYAFKYCCRSRGVKMEKTKMWYACLARVIRDGGFKIALIARLSAIPGHFTTAIFSTCGMGVIVFSIAAILSLPKQFITVYLGVILDSSSTTPTSSRSRLISDAVLAVTFLITVLAVWYLYRKMNQAKPLVIYDRRKARQAKVMRGVSPYQNPGSAASADVFNPTGSDSAIPLRSNMQGQYQQWDAQGRAKGYVVNDPSLNIVAPKPRANGAPFMPLSTPRDVEEGGTYDVHGRNDSTYSVGWEPTSQHAAHNAYSTTPQRGNFPPEMGQTPTQATFVNNSSGSDWRPGHSGPNVGPRPSFEDDSDEAYGGYEAVTPLVAGHKGGHYQESTGTTFATAYTSSPDARHEELPNPHHQPDLPPGAYLPEPPEYSVRRNVIR